MGLRKMILETPPEKEILTPEKNPSHSHSGRVSDARME